MDGYKLMQQIRQGGFTCKVNGKPHQVQAIALTAYAGEYDQQQAFKVGFQKHIPKPAEPEVLVNAISELMNSGKSIGDSLLTTIPDNEQTLK